MHLVELAEDNLAQVEEAGIGVARRDQLLEQVFRDWTSVLKVIKSGFTLHIMIESFERL